MVRNLVGGRRIHEASLLTSLSPYSLETVASLFHRPDLINTHRTLLNQDIVWLALK